MDMKKSKCDDAEVINCEHKEEVMDPVGYFLIRIIDGKLEVGLCSYDEVNVVKKRWIGDKPQDIYMRIAEDLPDIRKEHIAYLGKELARAWICMKTDVKYIQDGKMDGTFQEADMLTKKD